MHACMCASDTERYEVHVYSDWIKKANNKIVYSSIFSENS